MINATMFFRAPATARLFLPVCAFLCATLLSTTIAAADTPTTSPGAKVDAAAVYSLAQQVLGDIELIRMEMGIPKTEPLPIKVTGAAPWVSFHQAALLYDKANQLAFEFTRHKEPDIRFPPIRDITNSDVFKTLQLAHRRLIETKKMMGIPESTPAAPPAGPVTDDDVFLALVKIDNFVHQCLRAPIGPMLAYQRVTMAVRYASRLLEIFPDASRVMPDTPPLVRRKIPGETYLFVYECLRLAEQIAAKSGVRVMKLDVSAVEKEKVIPADVQNLAAIVVSNLSYLHSLVKDAKPPRQSLYPGRKYPSLVYQRAGILEAQLKDLSNKVSKHPRWREGVFNQ